MNNNYSEKIRAREYPPGVPAAAIDNGVSAVFAEFRGDTWRHASLREVVGVSMKAQYERNVNHRMEFTEIKDNLKKAIDALPDDIEPRKALDQLRTIAFADIFKLISEQLTKKSS